MRVVIDTNILISGTFFGGYPRRIVEAIASNDFEAYVSQEILDEYQEIVESFKNQPYGHLNEPLYTSFLKAAQLVTPNQRVEICRDPDDDKFIECALAAKALYIVNGDKDLLVLSRYQDTLIVTAKDFCEQYLAESS